MTWKRPNTMSEKLSQSNPFADPATVASYETWYETIGQRADRLEKALLNKFVIGFLHAHTLLEVGGGSGHFTRWFSKLGLQAVGLDLSPAMLAEARRLGSPPCVQGEALALPFPDGAFDLAALITTLEFVAVRSRPCARRLAWPEMG